jgi:polyhydroxyalkanoate synthesis regulator phasin
LNYKKKQHFKIYEAATKSLFADTKDRYDLDAVGAVNLLQKITDRCSDLGLRILNVPANKDALRRLIEGQDTVPGANLCHHHGTIRKELLKSYVKTFIDSPCREAQEDDMLCLMLQNSLTEKAYQVVTRDPSAYVVNGEKSGLMLLKAILEQSAIDSSIDPDVIRKELAHAYWKFKELKFDVRMFHDWVQQKLNSLKQTGHKSTDVATHLLTAYRTSHDEKLRLYIDRLEDVARESGTYLEEKDLMNKVKIKFDSLETARKLEAITQGDEIMALKAQIKSLKKKIDNSNESESSSDDSDEEDDQSGKERENSRKKKNGKSAKKRFPRELKKKPEPDDLSKPHKIDGVEWWYCKVHKWCKHKDADCRQKEDDDSGNANGDSQTDGNEDTQPTEDTVGGRAGRTIRAIRAVIAN